MAYSDQPWGARYGTLGDRAEREFEARYKLGFERSGWRRPRFRMRDLHSYERHRPDYTVSGAYIEVMGLGEDQVLKLKIEKLEALKFWRLLMPVKFWIWDSFRNRSVEVPLERIQGLVRDALIGHFPEGTPYYEIPAKELFADNERRAS